MPTSTAPLTFIEKLNIDMDGRTNRWLAEKSGIHESEISRIITGRLIPTDGQVDKIKAVFPTGLISKKK